MKTTLKKTTSEQTPRNWTHVCSTYATTNAAEILKMKRISAEAKHNSQPKYLGVKLDRTLQFKNHCKNVRFKVAYKNNILSKLINSSWGADPIGVRTTALSLCISATEYAWPLW